MKMKKWIKTGLVSIALTLLISPTAWTQSYNVWRGGEMVEEWTNPYKWNLKHTPKEGEAVHFREDISVVSINKNIKLTNGILLYGKELTLQGSGNIDMTHPISHQRTINIPASASGFANLTLNDDLSLHSRVALAAKSLGTSGGKGTFTLRNQTTASGTLTIGNNGCGNGKVYVHDDSTYHITDLQLKTKAEQGGSAEIHIPGGLVHIDCKTNPFMPFFEDASRKIVIGDLGTLKIESDLSLEQKVLQLKAMIQTDRLIAAAGCRLRPPVIDQHMIRIQAEDLRNSSGIDTKEKLLAAIDLGFTTQKELLAKKELQAQQQESAPEERSKLATILKEDKAQESNPKDEILAVVDIPQTSKSTPVAEEVNNETKAVAGYIVFLGTLLLMFRRPKQG